MLSFRIPWSLILLIPKIPWYLLLVFCLFRFLDLLFVSVIPKIPWSLFVSEISYLLSLYLYLLSFFIFISVPLSFYLFLSNPNILSLSIPEIPFVSEIPWLFSLISWSLLIPWSLLVSKIPLSQYLYFLSFVSFIPNLYIPLSLWRYLCHFTYQRLPILFLTVAALIWNRMPVVSLCAILISLFLDFYLLIPWSLPSLRYLYFLDL